MMDVQDKIFIVNVALAVAQKDTATLNKMLLALDKEQRQEVNLQKTDLEESKKDPFRT